MKIVAIQRTSFVDYPGKIAAVIFIQGCNLNCFYCQNRALIDGDSVTCGMTQEEALAWLDTRHGLLDAVVFSGGEPTLQLDLAGFMAEVHALGYLVKLDTNGTQPDVLASLIGKGVLDYVAMDIKGSPEKYDSICCTRVDRDRIDASIGILLSSRVDYEFRTTVVPQLTHSDFHAIAHRIRGARLYVLQRYRPVVTVRTTAEAHYEALLHSPEWAQEVVADIKTLIRSCQTRGFGVTGVKQ